MNEQYAVRWAVRRLRRAHDGVQWTKWHWTLDGGFTLCGRVIWLNRENLPCFPDTDDEAWRVDCVVCKKRLAMDAAAKEGMNE